MTDRGLDVHSIALDFSSADRTGSVSLQNNQDGKIKLSCLVPT